MTEILFLGHCYEPGKHDKIWGYIADGDRGALTFWGRRRGTLSFKHYPYISDAVAQCWTKSKKYLQVAKNLAHSEYLPEDFEGQVMLARLGQIKFA